MSREHADFADCDAAYLLGALSLIALTLGLGNLRRGILVAILALLFAAGAIWLGVTASKKARRSGTARPGSARTRPASARPPNSSPSPVTTIVLPAPVSPVITLRPGPSRSSALSIRSRFWTRSSRSTPLE